jgi:hypothetical protein
MKSRAKGEHPILNIRRDLAPNNGYYREFNNELKEF